MGKATDFKFGRYIHRVHPNKSPLKIFEKRKCGHIQGLPKFFEYSLLSQERLKLRASNFVRTFIGSIGTKARKKIWVRSREHSEGLSRIFRAPKVPPIYRVHPKCHQYIGCIARSSLSQLSFVVNDCVRSWLI